MARGRSLFSGGKRAVANKIIGSNVSHATAPKVDTSKQALEERAAERNQIPDLDLVFSVNALNGKKKTTITIDFTDIVELHPGQAVLVNQLLVGASLQPRITSGTGIRGLYNAIRQFIEFLNHPGNLLNSPVYSVADISSVICKTYTNYLARHYPKRSINRKLYGALRRIVTGFQEKYAGESSVGQKFRWPAGPAKSESTKEGYSPEAYNELANACIRSIREIMQLHNSCNSIKENKEVIQLKEWNLQNIMYWIHEKVVNAPESRSVSATIKHILGGGRSARDYLQAEGMSADDLINLYQERGAELAAQGRNPLGHSIDQKAQDLKLRQRYFRLSVSTLLNRYPGHPYCLDDIDAIRFLSAVNDKNRSLYERRLSLLVSRSAASYLDGALYGQEALYAGIHFIPETIYPFILLVQLNTGWNLESVLAISDDLDLHLSEDLIDPENYVVVTSFKGKTKKLVHTRTNKKNRFGTYRLLRYVESVIKKYKGLKHYHGGALWQSTLPSNSRHKTLTSADIFTYGASRSFLKRHQFKYFEGERIDHPRIRTTYETMREMMGFSEYQLSEDMGHSDVDTTSNYYASDSSSAYVKNQKIRGIQTEMVGDITDYKRRLVESRYLSELRESVIQSHDEMARKNRISEISKDLSLTDPEVIHLMSPEGQTFIAACTDSARPTWPGHDKHLNGDKTCRYFNKCCECNRAVIFPEALPYVARRILDIEDLKDSLDSYQWVNSYGVEYDAWKEIMDDWSNKDEVRLAEQKAHTGQVVLPTYMVGA